MTQKKHIDIPAAHAIIEELENIERRISLLKTYINPSQGMVVDTQVAANLSIGMQDAMDNVRDNLIRFL